LWAACIAGEVAASRVAAFIDVDDATALRILLADNRLAQLATYDQHQLADLLTAIGVDDLTGTGWDSEDLEQIITDLDDPASFGVICPNCGHEFTPNNKDGGVSETTPTPL
jgi:hypothetical protein